MYWEDEAPSGQVGVPAKVLETKETTRGSRLTRTAVVVCGTPILNTLMETNQKLAGVKLFSFPFATEILSELMRPGSATECR